MNTHPDPLAAYDYKLPAHLIAQKPADPRDRARLLVYHRSSDTVNFDTFANITNHLPKNAVLVLNETKVIPARFHCTKSTGGSVSMLYLTTEGDCIRVLAGGKLKERDTLSWHAPHSFTVHRCEEKEALLKPSFPIEELPSLLKHFGETPLPPYIKHSPLSEEQKRSAYQTVFAKQEGSVAAPTAGLHFTPKLLEKIRAHGCNIERVTLHVNLGTFAPVTEEHLRTRTLHEEWYQISPKTAEALNAAKREGRPIVAVGTTVVRTLESALSSPPQPPSPEERGAPPQLMKLSGSTRLFLSPENPPQFTDSLITNFHVPRSSLLMLVSAFVGREQLFELYQKAIDREFRFFSFGDGMLIL